MKRGEIDAAIEKTPCHLLSKLISKSIESRYYPAQLTFANLNDERPDDRVQESGQE